jgi:transcriptional regulator with XRE-family HTH domain
MDGRDIASARTYHKVSQIELADKRGVLAASLGDVENNKWKLLPEEYDDLLKMIEQIAIEKKAAA